MRSGLYLLLGALAVTPVFADEATPMVTEEPAPVTSDETTPTTAPTLSQEQKVMESQALGGRIARSTFTTNIVDREPVDSITELSTASDRVYYFTELLGMAGQTITHRWSHNGEVVAEVSFNVGGPRWRVWSSKNLMPAWSGDWKVSVVNAAGEVLGGNRFTYGAAQ